MDGDELLRRWLAQQREFGDTELVLPSLGAGQALDLIRHRSLGPAPAQLFVSTVNPPGRSADRPPMPEALGPEQGAVDPPAGDSYAFARTPVFQLVEPGFEPAEPLLCRQCHIRPLWAVRPRPTRPCA